MLHWEEIESHCARIGKEGYWADCYYNSQLEVVIKKFKEEEEKSKVNRVIRK